MAVKKTNRTIGKHETRLKYSDETETDNPKGQQTSADNKHDKPLIICWRTLPKGDKPHTIINAGQVPHDQRRNCSVEFTIETTKNHS